jgi:hypothetical protein
LIFTFTHTVPLATVAMARVTLETVTTAKAFSFLFP